MFENKIPVMGDLDGSESANVRNDSVGLKEESNTDYCMYENIYFAFIDVLGFKQTFDENRENSSKEFADGYKDVFNYYGKLMCNTNFRSVKPTNFGQTSDSLYFYTDRLDFLTEFIKIYFHFTMYSMSKNVFFRGGIAKGSLFISEPHQFYGDCVIKSYLLEEKISRYPRITIDNETYKDLKEKNYLESIPCEGVSGRYYLKPFVNVSHAELKTIISLGENELKKYKEEDIIKNIENAEKRFEFDDKNYLKYNFLHAKFDKYKSNSKNSAFQEVRHD